MSNTTRKPSDRGLRLRMRYEGERVQSQHTQLGELHQLIADALGRGEVHSARSAFEQFQAALRAHLEVEERIYFPALHGLCPALAAEVARLVQEHDAIVALLPGLRGLLGAGEMELSSERLHQLAQVLSAHEAEEEALIRECLQSQRPNDTEDEER